MTSKDQVNPVTRDHLEKFLWEFTGFQGDASHIDAAMLAIDSYALSLNESLITAHPAVADAYLHLIVQMGTELLDTAGRIAATVKLADQVQALTERSDRVESELEKIRELLDTLAAVITATPEPFVAVSDNAEIPDWELELLQSQLRATRAEAETLPAETAEAVLAVLPQYTQMQLCTLCNVEKPVSEFFRNKKAKSGYESRCRECRGKKVA